MSTAKGDQGGRKRGAPATATGASAVKKPKLEPEVQNVVDVLKETRPVSSSQYKQKLREAEQRHDKVLQKKTWCETSLKHSLEAALLESDMRGIAWFEERKTHQATRQLLTRIYTTFVDEMRTIHEQDPQIREKVTDSLHKAFGKHIVKEENIKAPEEGPLKKDSRASEWVYGIESQLCDKFPDCLCSSFDDSLEFE